MVNRVLLQPSLLRVSNPGVDVFAANWSQIMFDSQWSQPSVLLRGSGVYGPAQSGGNYKRFSVWFNKNFGKAPICSVIIGGWMVSGWQGYRSEWSEFDGQEYWGRHGVSVYPDRLEFWMETQDPYDYNPNMTYNFVVLDYPL